MLFADIPACATISTTCFLDSEYDDIIQPHRRANPLAYWYSAATSLRHAFVGRYSWAFVAYATKPDSESGIAEGEILGYCRWGYSLTGFTASTQLDLNGNPKPDVASPPVEPVHTGLFWSLERLRAGIEKVYFTHPLSPYHIPSKHRVPLSSLWKTQEPPPGSQPPVPPSAPLPPHFYLYTLAVSPGAQRRGVGKALVKYSFENLVGKHHVPVSLTASGQGRGLYSSAAFRTVGTVAPPGMGYTGGMVMVWDGEGRWVRAVTEEDKKAAGGKVLVWGQEVDGVYVDRVQGRMIDNIPI